VSKMSWETRLALLFTSVLLASLLFQILYVVPFIQSREEQAARLKQQVVARDIARELDIILENSERSLRKMADQPTFRQMQIGDQPDIMDHIIETSACLNSLFVLNSEGWFVAGSVSDLSPYTTTSYADRAFFTDPFVKGSTHFSAPRFYPELGLSGSAVSVPLVSESGERVGVLLGGMRLNEWIDSIASYPLPEGTVAFLVDNKGTVVAHSGMDLFALDDGPLSLDMSDHPLVIAIMSGREYVNGEHDCQGIAYLGSPTAGGWS